MAVTMRLLALAATAATVALSCLMGAVSGEYGPRDAVTVLTEQNFEQEVLQSGDYWLVEFYAPWCGHCQKLEPEYKAAAKKLKQHALDATANQKLAQKYRVQGYPTIKEFGAKKKRPRDYQGGRSRADIVQYVKSSEEAKRLGVGGGVVATLELASVHSFLTSKALPSAIFFGSSRKQARAGGRKPSGSGPAWLRAVADHFTTPSAAEHGKKRRAKKTPTVQIGFVPGSDDKIAKHFGLDEDALPTVLFVDASGTKFTRAEDASSLDEASATAFISRALAASADTAADFASVPLFPSPEAAKKKPKVALQALTPRAVRRCLSPSIKHMCVMVATDTDADADAVRALAKKYRRDPLAFYTVGSTDAVFRAVASFVGEPASDHVHVLVIKAGRRIKYSALARSQAPDAPIDAFLDKLLDGSSALAVASGDQDALEAALDSHARSEPRDEL